MQRWHCLLLLFALLASPCLADGIDDSIAVVKSVQARGEGNSAAVAAVSSLATAAKPDDLVRLLSAMDDADPLALNWLRGAFEAAAAKSMQAKQFPVAAVEAFAKDRKHVPRVRRLAYEWILKADSNAAERFDLINDPSPEMRRDAVATLIAEAQQLEGDAAKRVWQTALSGAVDADQVETISTALKKLGESFNYVQHFGLLVNWHVMGPFDNVESKGFSVVYPPETEVRLDAEYDGQKGAVSWQQFQSDEEDGAFDLAKLTAPHKGAIDYMYTEFNAQQAQDVEFRLGTANAWKLWVNGELVFSREEYHRGMSFDQYLVPGQLRAGKNTFLIKVCQNEQDQEWAQRWAVQFRICDAEGRAVHAAP